MLELFNIEKNLMDGFDNTEQKPNSLQKLFGRMTLNDSALPPQSEPEFEEMNSASFKP